MRWNVAVTPIRRNHRSLNHTSVGALHNDFCSFVFCLPSIAEPAANSCFHEQEGLFSAGGNIRSVTWTSLLEWGMHAQLPWRYIRIQFELTEVAWPFLPNSLGMRLKQHWMRQDEQIYLQSSSYMYMHMHIVTLVSFWRHPHIKSILCPIRENETCNSISQLLNQQWQQKSVVPW